MNVNFISLVLVNIKFYYQYVTVVVILSTDHYTPGTYHDGVHHFVNFVPSSAPGRVPAHQTSQPQRSSMTQYHLYTGEPLDKSFILLIFV